MNLVGKRRPPKPANKLLECETVVVSSDEEDNEKNSSVKQMNDTILGKLGSSVTISPISKEPSIVEIQKFSIMTQSRNPEASPQPIFNMPLVCRTVRIGSYRFVPLEPVRIDTFGFTVKVPHPSQEGTVKTIRVSNTDVVKVLASFQKSLPVLFFYLPQSVGTDVRAALDMTPESDYFFDPLSETDESHRRITMLPEGMSEEGRMILTKIYADTYDCLEELTYKEMNDILIKTCPKELTKPAINYGTSEVKPILMYPFEGTGRITISVEDYLCLAQDQFLNDVIIDFYLKYLWLNLPTEQKEKVHVFSTFFYKRLTTKPVKASRKSQPTELDPTLSQAQKRHARVKTWTKSVNIFEKDYIIVPINENCHWFLAIICFPSLNGSYTMDGEQIIIEPRQTTKNKKDSAGNKNKPADKKPDAINCEEEASDKDEAEGDDSELDTDESSDEADKETPKTVENDSNRPPIKQPCILIFDSLAPGASRSRVVATLRDYLTCEYKAKNDADRIFTKDIIKGACPKVPQQTNFTDCGLYLLQYVEHFFKEPIKDYYIPINSLKNWFEEIVVTRKREDVALLIKSLMQKCDRDTQLLPDITFPTLNGEVIEPEPSDNFADPDMTEEQQGEEPQEEEEEETPAAETPEKAELKPSSESALSPFIIERPSSHMDIFKPDLSELAPKQTNRETLSYLKAKRIVRHKNVNSETVSPEHDVKRARTDEPAN